MAENQTVAADPEPELALEQPVKRVANVASVVNMISILRRNDTEKRETAAAVAAAAYSVIPPIDPGPAGFIRERNRTSAGTSRSDLMTARSRVVSSRQSNATTDTAIRGGGRSRSSNLGVPRLNLSGFGEDGTKK